MNELTREKVSNVEVYAFAQMSESLSISSSDKVDTSFIILSEKKPLNCYLKQFTS